MEPRRLYIISKARSGSNQLATYFNQVPACRCYGEIFKPGYPRNRVDWRGIARRFASPEEARTLHRDDLCAFWDRLVVSNSGTHRIVGVKIFYDDRRQTPIWESRVFRPDSLIVHLWRDAIFDTYVSLLRAEASGQWARKREDDAQDAPAEGLRFDIEAYKAYRHMARRWFVRTERKLAGHLHTLRVEYAEIAQPDQLGHRIGAFLGEPVTLRETHVKQTPRAPISYLDNPQDAAPFVNDRLSLTDQP